MVNKLLSYVAAGAIALGVAGMYGCDERRHRINDDHRHKQGVSVRVDTNRGNVDVYVNIPGLDIRVDAPHTRVRTQQYNNPRHR